jgi:hypothetical protein
VPPLPVCSISIKVDPLAVNQVATGRSTKSSRPLTLSPDNRSNHHYPQNSAIGRHSASPHSDRKRLARTLTIDSPEKSHRECRGHRDSLCELLALCGKKAFFGGLAIGFFSLFCLPQRSPHCFSICPLTPDSQRSSAAPSASPARSRSSIALENRRKKGVMRPACMKIDGRFPPSYTVIVKHPCVANYAQAGTTLVNRARG